MVGYARQAVNRIIRLALSLEGALGGCLRTEFRDLVAEQLVIYRDSDCPADATQYREDVYRAFTIRQKSPAGKYRHHVLSTLLNGDIRKRGVVEHYCRGCCKSQAETLRTFRRVVVPCLLPPAAFRVLDRQNWTGSDVAICDIALPSLTHGLLEAAYCRVTSASLDGAHGAPDREAYLCDVLLPALPFKLPRPP